MCITKLLPIVLLSITIIDGKTRKCFDDIQSEYHLVGTEKNIPIEFVVQQESTGMILTSMMKIYLEEILGFQNLTVSHSSDDSDLTVRVTMVNWILRKPRGRLHEIIEPSGLFTPIEMIGWQGWFVPNRFSVCNHWMMFQNPKFALRHPVNATALTMIENSAKNPTFSERCESPCTIMLVSELSPELIYQIDNHRLYIQVYEVGPHLGRVTSSLLETYPSMFFILLHDYPSELTYSREKFVSIEKPGPNRFFNLYHTIDTTFQYKYHISTLVRVIDNAYLSPEEYLQLLGDFNNRSDGYEVACNWLNRHKARALEWTNEREEESVIVVMLPSEFKAYSDASFFETVALVRRALEKKRFPVNYQLRYSIPTSLCFATSWSRPSECDRLVGATTPTGPPEVRYPPPIAFISYMGEAVRSFSTMDSNEPYKYMYSKFFKNFHWRRIAVIAAGGGNFSEFLSDTEAIFRSDNIGVLSAWAILARWGFSEIAKTLLDIVQREVKIIVVDEALESVHAIVCAAFHLNMTAERGYVWCFSGLWNADWWREEFMFKDQDISCTSEDVFRVIDGHFNIAHESDEIVQPLGRYAGFLYDACWTLIEAFNRIERNVSNALDYIHESGIERFQGIISESDFNGTSGRVRFDRNGSRRIDYRIEQFVNQSYRTVNISDIVWVSGSMPTDGRKQESTSVPGCIFKPLAEAFDISCDDAYWIVIFIVIVSLAFPIVFGSIVYKKRYNEKSRIRKSLLKSRSGMIPASHDLVKLELQRNQLVIDRQIGEGAFGKVHRADAFFPDVGWVSVAVKTLKLGSSIIEKSDFLTELEVMRTFDHPNLVKLIGVCTKSEPILTVMEFMVHGDLKSFLQDRKGTSAERLTRMALDVVRGLNYLDESRYVHRDVAARNCLVNSELVVKLGDFGMTRAVHENYYYRFSRRGLFPVRWMAKESLTTGVSTPASDIWSYGILLYEIITFGQTPYHEKTNEQVIEYLKDGHTLPIPATVEPELKTLMASCWMTDPKERPTALEIIATLEANPILIHGSYA